MDKKKLIFTAILLGLAMLLVFGCGSEKKASTTKKVTVGLLRLSSSAPLFVGMEKGFFAEAGIDLQPEWFDAAQPVVVATASNKVDVGATGITAGLYNLAAQGQKINIVADKGREQKGFSSNAVVVATDLYNSGVRSVKDLKGKKIGITQSGSTFHYTIGRLLEINGLSLKDVELVPLGKMGSMMASLQSKQVDAIVIGEPNVSRILSEGYGKVILPVGDAMEYQTSAIFYSPAFTKDKELAVKFMTAYIKSVNYYSAAVLQKEKGANYKEVIDIITKYTQTPAADVEKGLPYIDPNGELLAADIQTQLDWYYKQGMIEKPLEAKQVVDMSFWSEGMKKAGK